MNNRNINLDMIRILAMFMVMGVHIGQYTSFDFHIGAKGVQLFFIISGYLAVVSLDKDPNIYHYYKKRYIRILPSYYFALLIMIISNIFFGGRELLNLRSLRYVLCIQSFFPSDDWNLWNNYKGLWTMSCFVFFYLLIPIIYKVINRFYSAFAFLIILCVLNPFLIEKINQWGKYIGYQQATHIEWYAICNPFTNLYCFMFGVTLFFSIKENKTLIYAIINIIVLLFSEFSLYQWEISFTILVMLNLILPAVKFPQKLNKLISFFSRGTFTVYLLHPLILEQVKMIIVNKNYSTILQALIYFLSCIVVSYLIYYFIVSKIEKIMVKK